MIKYLYQFLIILIFLLGCNKDQYIRTYKVYKQPLDIQSRESLLGAEIIWNVPESWVEYDSDSSMRLSSFQVPYYGYDDSKIDYGDLSIFVFQILRPL